MTRPAIRVVANGKDITTLLADKNGEKVLVSLTVTDEAGIKSDCAELVIDNREHFAVPPIGSELEIWLGYEPQPNYMGRYRLDDWTMSGPPNTLTLSATSAELTTEIKGAKTRSWHDTTLGSIIGTVAGEHSLGQAVDPDLAAVTVEHIDQQSESDLAFLSRLAKRNGGMFKLADGKVVFAKKGAAPKETRTVRPERVTSWSITESERGGHTCVICYWHDHDTGRRRKVTAGSGKPVHRDKRLYRTEVEAQSAADATLGELRRGKRAGNLELVGDPHLFAENEIELAGFHPDVDRAYNAKSVMHTFDSSGFTTSVSLELGGDSE